MGIRNEFILGLYYRKMSTYSCTVFSSLPCSRMAPGLRRSAATSTASSVRGLKRVQPSRIFSSVTSRSQLASGRMHSTIPLSRTLSYKPKKAMKGRNSPQIKNSKTLRPKSANMATNYRSSSSIDMSFKANVSPGHITLGSSAGSVDSLDRLAIKRKRWM